VSAHHGGKTRPRNKQIRFTIDPVLCPWYWLQDSLCPQSTAFKIQIPGCTAAVELGPKQEISLVFRDQASRLHAPHSSSQSTGQCSLDPKPQLLPRPKHPRRFQGLVAHPKCRLRVMQTNITSPTSLRRCFQVSANLCNISCVMIVSLRLRS
jgi:hypothetical protein